MQLYAALLLAVLTVASGCAQTRWVHPTADAARAAADREECDNAARVEAQQQVLFESLSRRPVMRGGVVGYPRAGGSFQERNSEWYWTQHFLDRCMHARGYRLARVE